jgi:hypothetical protein
MSRSCQRFSAPTTQRNRNRGCRRLRLESLEPRACPAVMFDLVQGDAGGILRVTGDDQPNVIEILQPREGVVEVTGDGERRTFDNVDEIFVATLGGDDATTYSRKPKEIVVVGSKIKMQMGAGNDTVRIDDGGATDEPLLADTPLEFAVDLGTGADYVSAQVQHHPLVDAIVVSADGDDRVDLEIRPSSRAVDFYDIKSSVQLGGGGNELKMVTENVGDVVLLYSSLPGGASTGDGGNITLIAGSNLTPGRGGAGVNGGNITLVAHNGSSVEASLAVDLALGDEGDSMHVSTIGYKDGKLHLGGSFGADEATLEFTAAEPDPVGVNSRLFVGNLSMNSGSDVVGIDITGFPNVDLGLNADDGDDEVTIGLLLPAVQRVEAVAARIELAFAGGNNIVNVNSDGFDRLDLDLIAEGGGNTFQFDGNGGGDAFMDDDLPPWCRMALDFGGGGNLVTLNTQEFNQTDLDLRASGGNNVVKHEVGHTLGFRHEHTRPEAQINVDLRGGGNFVEVRMENIVGLDLKIITEPPPPISVTGDTINVSWHVISNSSGTVNVGCDDGFLQIVSLSAGNPQAIGISPTSFSFTATEGGTNPASANLALTTGSDDDTLSIQSLNVGDLDLNLDLGEGQDAVAIDAKVNDAGDRTILGSDVNVLTRNVEHVKSDLTLPGSDNNVAIAALLPETADGNDSALEIGLALGGGGNDVNVRSQNMDGVVLLYSSLPGGASTGNGGNITLVAGASLPPAGGGAGVKGGSVTLVAYSGTAQGSLVLNLTTGDGPDVVDVSVTDFANVSLNLDTGAADDQVGVDLIHNEDFAGDVTVASHHRGVDASASIDLGPGNDALSFVSAVVSSLELLLTAGDGDDTAVIDGTSNALPVGERAPSRMVVDLGGGNDNLDLHTTDLGDFELELTAGDGNDTINASDQGPTLIASRVHYSFSLGDGDDRLTTEVLDHAFVTSVVDAGVGDDEVEVHAQAGTPAVLLYRFSSNTVVDLGGGNNQLLVETTAFADVTQDFRSGGGNDQMIISDRAGPFFQFESKRLHQQVHTGGGNDIVLDDTGGSDDVKTAIDTGSGNDIAFVFTRIDTGSRQTTFVVDLSLGPGSDLALVDTVGYSQISAAIDTGPAGDGRDVVIASFRFSPLDRMRRIRRLADSGLDLFELFVGQGYDVQIDISGTKFISTMNYTY